MTQREHFVFVPASHARDPAKRAAVATEIAWLGCDTPLRRANRTVCAAIDAAMAAGRDVAVVRGADLPQDHDVLTDMMFALDAEGYCFEVRGAPDARTIAVWRKTDAAAPDPLRN